MDVIVVFDRQADGNPIVAMHSRPTRRGPVELKDIHPDDDPAERGVVMVPDDVVAGMVLREYRRDAEGRVVEVPVLQEKTKDLVSVPDTALGQNIVVFGEPVAELISLTDLKGQRVSGTLIDRYRGVIGVDQRSGLFSVDCRVETGARQPEVVSERQNWRWKRDAAGTIVGMELIDNTPYEATEAGRPRR